MNRKIVKYFVIFVVVVQLPFTIIGLSVTFGIMNDGANYLLAAYQAALAAGLERSQPPQPKVVNAEIQPPTKVSNKQPEAISLPHASIKRTRTRPVEAQALPAIKIDPTLPRRRIDLLEIFELSSPLGRGLASIPDLSVDYVSVPIISKNSENTIEIRFRKGGKKPRVLLLAGSGGVSWHIAGSVPASLLAIFVVSPTKFQETIIARLPNTLPVMRLDATRAETPFLQTAMPDCNVSDLRNLLICTRVNFDRKTRQYRSRLEVAEQTIGINLGLRLASISSANAHAKDRLILVPEVIIDETFRQQARQQVEKYVAALDARTKYREVLKSYQRHWIEQRRQSVFRQLEKQPPMALGTIVPLRPRVVIVNAQRGLRRHPGIIKSKQVATYGEYRAIQEGKTGTISVRVETQEPTVIVATAVNAVNWLFDIAENANVLAVHIEGTHAPTLAGVPANIPIIVRSKDYGDRNTAGRITKLYGEQPTSAFSRRSSDHVDRFMKIYNGSLVTLISDDGLNSVKVKDAAPRPTEQSPP